jgi:hypothetical protein
MNTLPLLLQLALAVAPPPADVPRVEVVAPIVRTYDVSRLSEVEAARLVGKRARFKVELDSDEWDNGRRVVIDCKTSTVEEKTLWLLPGEEAADEMTVEARLVIRHHPGWGQFPAFTELRLLDARRVQD